MRWFPRGAPTHLTRPRRHDRRRPSTPIAVALLGSLLLAGTVHPATVGAQDAASIHGSLAPIPYLPELARGGFLATAEGPGIALTLPAALAYNPQSRTLLGLELIDGNIAGGTVAWQPGCTAFTYRHQDARVLGYNEDQYGIVLSRKGDARVSAIDLTWLRNDVAGTADAMSFGLSYANRPSAKLSIATRIMHLNRPRFLDGRLERTYAVGIGFRPRGHRLTIATDAFYRGEAEDQLKVRYGVEFEPFDGFHLAAAIDDEDGFRLALSVRDRQNQVGYGFAEDADGFQRQFIHLGYEERPAASRFDRRRRTGHLRLGGTYRDDRRHGLLTLGARYRSLQPTTDLLELLRDDAGFDGLVLEIGPLGGTAAIDAIRRRVLELRAEGKRIVAYIGGRGTYGQFYLASAADRVVFPPGGVAGLFGIASIRTYYTGLLDRLGVSVERYPCRRCTYKSAYATWTDHEENPAYREQTTELVETFHAHLVRGIAEGRGLPEKAVRGLTDGRLLDAEELLEAGLVDRLGLRATADTLLAELLGRPPRATAPVRVTRPRPRRWGEPPRVAVVIAQGAIVEGNHRSTPYTGNLLGAHSLAATLRHVAHDQRVAAVVLRIDSPGGSMFGAEVIRDAVLQLAAAKPLVVSMGPIAASGGYAIASPAHEIIALPLSITGSVGVTYIRPDLARAHARLGLFQSVVKTGESVDLFNSGRAPTDRERAMLLDRVDHAYDRFLAQVAGDRGFTLPEAEEVARGRVFVGEHALAAGLVDRLGDLEDAVESAARAAELGSDYTVVTLRRGTASWWQRLRGAAGGGIDGRQLVGAELWDQPLALLEEFTELLEN